MANQIIRDTLQKEGVRYWELADAMSIHPGTLSAKLRHDLPESEIHRLLNLIRNIRKEKESEVIE